LIRKNLESRIVAQAIGVIGVLISRDDLIDSLTEKRQNRVTDSFIFTRVTYALGQTLCKAVALVESAEGQQTGVTTDLPATKIHTDGFCTVEREIKLWYTRCHFADAPKGNVGFAKTQCSSTF
jgi:hypothetical protein